MYITLELDKEGQIKLLLEAEIYKPNPLWVDNWVKNNISYLYEGSEIEFSCIYGEQILNFLETLVKLGQNKQISNKIKEQSSYNLSISIESVEHAERLLPSIRRLVISAKINEKEFELLKEQPNISLFPKLSSKEQ